MWFELEMSVSNLLKMDAFYVEYLFYEMIAHLSLMTSIAPQIPIHLMWETRPDVYFTPTSHYGLDEWAPLFQKACSFYAESVVDFDKEIIFLRHLSRRDIPDSSILAKFLGKGPGRTVKVITNATPADKTAGADKVHLRGSRGVKRNKNPKDSDGES